MDEKGISPPPGQSNWFEKIGEDTYRITVEAWKWLSQVRAMYPKVQTFRKSLTPAAVNANSESVQTFTVTGLSVLDTVIVNKPTNQSGLDLVTSWVSTADTLSIKYRNHTGGGITPTAENYLITSVRL